MKNLYNNHIIIIIILKLMGNCAKYTTITKPNHT
jgi:hypothetical protein